MKLYYAPGACSLATHIAAREAGIDLDLLKVDLKAGRLEDGRSFKEISPKGYVPAVTMADGGVLTEGSAILQYLVDQAPAGRLAPAAGTTARYRFLEWLTFISSEVHKGFGPLWNPASSAETKDAARAKLGERFAYLDKELAGRTYLGGDEFSAADAYLFTVMNWAGMHQVDLTPYANLRAYLGRVGARPAVQDAMRHEGLLKEAA